MTKNLKFFGRWGAKDQDIKHFKEYLPMDIKTIIEPFGGSYALCRCVYKSDAYEKIVNDTDTAIIEIFLNPQKLKDSYNEWNDLRENGHSNKEQVHAFLKIWNEKIKDCIISQFVMNELLVRGYMIKKKPNFDDGFNFMKDKIIFSSVDAFECIKKYSKDENNFIFLDPPYMFSNNESYSNQTIKTDCTDYLIKIKKIFGDEKTKAKIMLIINDLHIIRHMFKKYTIKEYSKIYGISKRTETHLIIMNY